jgi:hypothetical protein
VGRGKGRGRGGEGGVLLSLVGIGWGGWLGRRVEQARRRERKQARAHHLPLHGCCRRSLLNTRTHARKGQDDETRRAPDAGMRTGTHRAVPGGGCCTPHRRRRPAPPPSRTPQSTRSRAAPPTGPSACTARQGKVRHGQGNGYDAKKTKNGTLTFAVRATLEGARIRWKRGEDDRYRHGTHAWKDGYSE